MKFVQHFFLFLLIPGVLFSQSDDPPHTELNWFSIETEHFLVHFHAGEKRTAQHIAMIAEAIYEPVTNLYQHKPDQKVSFVIRDYDDYSNGAAYFYDNKIEIWAPAMDFDLRGMHPWLWNVVTHEFTHIVQIQTSMKLGRKIPGVYFQWFGYEAERRPDVLYGFPNVLVSYPLSAFVVPSWFAEGAAQFNHPDLHFDFWDSHRDMILRMSMLDGTTLGWEEMAVFGKTSLGNESAYNAGFSIVQYINEKYGTETLKEISRSLGSLHRLTIDGAIEATLGISGGQLYHEWKAEREKSYRALQRTLEPALVQGEIIERDGFGNFYPQFTPDGKSIAYVSNKGHDYFGQSALYLFDSEKQSRTKVLEGVRSQISFSPDGRFVYYTRASSDNPHWSRVFDLYRYDRQEKDETRLTHGLRAVSARVSADGKKIVFTAGSDGTMNLGVCDSSGQNIRMITQFQNGEQVYTPSWSPDGTTIAAGFSTGDGQSIISIDEQSGTVAHVISDGDCRNPCFSADGSILYYASDRTGIFNVYGLDRLTGETTQWTNVLGGAFVPSVSADGRLAFASYTSSGYKISLLPAGHPLKYMMAARSTETPARTSNKIYPERPDTADTSSVRPYRSVFTSLSLIPMIRIDNYNPKNRGWDVVKPGLYFTSSDVLEKISLFGGAALNRKFERDLFAIIEYKDRLPLLSMVGLEPALSLELYNITRKTTSSFALDPSPVLITPEITYNLFEVDISLRQRIVNDQTNLRMWYTLNRYSADIGSFVNPNDNTLVPAFRSTYLIGNTFAAEIRYKGILPSAESEINPLGTSVLFRYAHEANEFNQEGEFRAENGSLVPVYTDISFHRLEVQWDEHVSGLLDHHTINLGLRGAGILGKTVDSFFDFYGGGVVGMKGYPFYALGGNTVATANLSYRVPVMRDINVRVLQFYFTKLYASVFADVGNAWTGSPNKGGAWKKDVGFELRLEAFSFYAYPTRFFFSGAYGLDKFERIFSGVTVPYGKEWRFYFGVLFGFELNDIGRLRP